MTWKFLVCQILFFYNIKPIGVFYMYPALFFYLRRYESTAYMYERTRLKILSVSKAMQY